MLAPIGFFAALFLLGWVMLRFFHDDLTALERAALAYGVGAGIFTWSVFLGSNLGLPIALTTGAGVGLVLVVGCLVLLKRKPGWSAFGIPKPLTNLSASEIALIGLIGGIVLVIFLAALYWPPRDWDALTAWVFKGKLIAAKESLALIGLSDAPYYPLNLSLQVAYLNLLGDPFAKAIFPIYFVALVLIFFANLWKFVGTRLALACTLFLSATSYLLTQAHIAYANVAFAFYYVASSLYLYRFLKERKTTWLVLAGLLIGIAGWTRTEVLLYLAINLAVLVIFSPMRREMLKSLAIYGGIFLVSWLPWTIYARFAGFNDLSGYALGGIQEIAAGHFDTARILQILDYFREHALPTSEWGFLWLAFPLALIVGFKRLREHAPLVVLIALNALGLIYTYYAAGRDTSTTMDWWLYTGFDRMALHWAPLIVFYFGLTLAAGFSKVSMFPFRIRLDPYLVLVILFSIFAIGPLLAPGYFWGAHDGRHSVYFLFEFDRSIQDGIFYPRWAPDYTFGYGYPMFNIYAPGSLYASEALHLLGFDFVTATKIVFGLAIILSGMTMFGLVKRLTGSSRAAFVSGVAYVYMPYHIADVYVRAALAESVALIFLPLTFWGFYETVVAPRRAVMVATAFAYAAMMFSHNGIALMMTAALGIWVLVLMFGEMQRPRQLPISNYQSLVTLTRFGLPALAALALGIGLVSVFLIPAALEYNLVRTDQWLGNYYDFSNHFAYFFQLFDPTWGFGISKAGPQDEMSFQLGVVPVILAILSILAILKNPNNTRRFWIFFALMASVIAALMLSFSLPLWNVLRPILSFAQFPWRLLTLTTIPLAVLAGAIVALDETRDDARGDALPTILLGALIVLGSYPYLTAQMILEPKEGPVSILGLFRFQQSAGEMTGSTAWVKEIPDWSPIADVYFAGKRVKSKIDFTDVNPDDVWFGVDQTGKGLRANGERVLIDSKLDDFPVTFNTFYYPGWRAYLTPEHGDAIARELKIEPVGELGRIQVRVPQGRYWLTLRFDDSPPRVVGQWVSLASIMIALILLAWDIRKKRIQNSEARRQKAEG